MSGAASRWRLRIFEALESTQSLVSGLAEAGEPDGLAVMARRQTAGRGREGRGWEGPSGNLALSVLLRPGGPARDLPQYGLLAAVALHETASRFASGLSLKWPNDLLRDGAKCAGILAEGAVDGQGGIAHLVLGFGVNLAHAPEVPGRATAALGPVVPEEFAEALLVSLDAWMTRRLVGGFAPIRAGWEAAGPTRGETLTLRQGTGTVSGRYEGLAEDGGLMLATGGRVHRFLAGEVGD
ncbi:biotin--[acetyl-CoA-carboxylase] ligase [Sabulicella rubraurantiaca]|uniref:biotin--[acetyl-CoA-carboxylase] ligase n=1 Tax=Sabulicella rubraurantiaca TaxID=2811429 RepID=UPI001A959BE0|nr:biotin--[acetyl-CoA-carboxylase] ligase [Sabulicella rubraurantiaca]